MTYIRYSLIFLFMLSTGCATFRDGPNPPITKWPTHIKTKTIAIQVNYNASLNDKPASWHLSDSLLNEVFRAYVTSGLFLFVRDGSDTQVADLRAVVNFTEKQEGIIALAFVSVFTLGLIPSYEQIHYTINTTVEDMNGNILGSFEKSESSRAWLNFFMLPITPFTKDVLKEMMFDLNRLTILEAHSKGIYR